MNRTPQQGPRGRHGRQAPRPEPRFSWFVPIDGDGDHIGTERAERPPTFAYLRDVAQEAERLGYHSLLVPTRFANGLFDATAPLAETWTTATALAASTSRIRFLIAVRPGFVAPGLLAQMAATLADLSGGRIDLNIVPGGIQGEYEKMGMTLGHDARYAYAEEIVRALRALWSADGPVDFAGEHLRLDGVQASMDPSTRRPEFYLGGASDAAFDLAGRNADALLAWIQPHDALAALIDRARARFAALGRTDGPRLGLRTHLVVGATEAGAWDAADELLSRAAGAVKAQRQAVFAGTAMVGQRAQLQTAGSQDDPHRIGAHLWNGISQVRVNCGTAVVGDPQQVADELVGYWELGFDEFILSGWPHLETSREVAATVLPLVRDAVAARR